MLPNETREQAHARAALDEPHHRRPKLTEDDMVKVRRPGTPLGYILTRRDWMEPGDQEWTGNDATPAERVFREGFDLEAMGFTAAAADALMAAGFADPAVVLERAEKDPEWYLSVSGVGKKNAARLVEEARSFLEE